MTETKDDPTRTPKDERRPAKLRINRETLRDLDDPGTVRGGAGCSDCSDPSESCPTSLWDPSLPPDE